MRRDLVSVSLRYISLSLCSCVLYCDNKIKLKYGWQLTERNEWKLLNRLRYGSVTKSRKTGKLSRGTEEIIEGGNVYGVGCVCAMVSSHSRICSNCCKLSLMNAPISRQWFFLWCDSRCSSWNHFESTRRAQLKLKVYWNRFCFVLYQ